MPATAHPMILLLALATAMPMAPATVSAAQPTGTAAASPQVGEVAGPRAAGAEWIGVHVPVEPTTAASTRAAGPASDRVDVPYAADPRIAGMLGRTTDRVHARWLARRYGAQADQPFGELGLRFEHHQGAPPQPVAGSARHARKNGLPVQVELEFRDRSGARVGAFTVWNASFGDLFVASVDEVARTMAVAGEPLWLHVAPPAPLAMARIGVDVAAGQGRYTVTLDAGEPVDVRYLPDEGVLRGGFTAEYRIDGYDGFWRQVGDDGLDRIALAPGTSAHVRLRDVPSPHHAAQDVYEIGTRRGQLALPLLRGALVDLQLDAPALVTVSRTQARLGYWRAQPVFSLAEGGPPLQVLVPRNDPVDIAVEPWAPWLPESLRGLRFATDAPLRVRLQRGVHMTAEVLDEHGESSFGEVNVIGRNGFRRLRQGSGYPVAVPRDEPLMIEARGAGASASREARLDADGTTTLQLSAHAQLAGRVTDASGQPVPWVRVEAWRNGERMGSTLTLGEGHYELTLPAGPVELRAFHEGSDAPVARVHVQQAVLAASGGTVEIRLPRPATGIVLRNARACGALQDRRAALALDAAGTRPAARLLQLRPGVQTRLDAEPGEYRIRIELPGFATWSGTVVVPAQGTVALDLSQLLGDSCMRWTGTLRGASGEPLGERAVVLSTPAQEPVGWSRTDAAGRFDLPLGDGLIVELTAPVQGQLLRKVVVVDRDRGGFERDATLPALELAATPTPDEGVPQLLHGDAADRTRLDLVFIAEGYVAQQEAFEDRNGNGLWDGVLYADLDGNDAWTPGEPFTVHGDAPWPDAEHASGDIGADNEPFVDRNADGYPNIDDPSVFALNVRDFMRSLLSVPLWSRYADAFNVWALWFDSPQAGMDLLDADRSVVQERDTRFGVQWQRDRSLLAVDAQAVGLAMEAANLAQRAVPVVLINQPVAMGRANAFMLYPGGMASGGPNAKVASHELGHVVGGLADEYSEFRGNRVGGEGSAPNESSYPDAAFNKWAWMIRGEPALHAGEAGDGMLDGGSYYQGGTYRPSHMSAMRSSAVPLFNVASRKAVDDVLCAASGSCTYPLGLRSGVWWAPAESGWGLFVVDHGDVQGAAWFTYDTDGTPTWFLLVARRQNAHVYHGDVLRMTGTSFAAIDGPAMRSTEIVGDATLRYDGEDALEFSFEVDAESRRMQLQPFPFDRHLDCSADDAGNAGANATGVWWNPAQSGWGLFLVDLDARLFAGWYTYDADSSPVFMTAAAERTPQGTYAGSVYRQRDGTPWPGIDGRPPSAQADQVGMATFGFHDDGTGTFAWTIGDASGASPIARLQFGSAVPRCATVDAR